MNQNTKNGFAPAPEANQGCRDWAIHRTRNGFGSEHGLAMNDFAASPHFDWQPNGQRPVEFRGRSCHQLGRAGASSDGVGLTLRRTQSHDRRARLAS
jgi:hypothetical protein